MSNKNAPQFDADAGVDTSAAFVVDDTPAALPIVRRSELQNYGESECYAKARFIELGRVITASRPADIGHEGHEAIAEATDEYVQAAGALHAPEIADIMRGRLLKSRPDIQPQVLDAVDHCKWKWARFLDGINPANIKKYDGGKGPRSGQLAWDIAKVCRVTAEIDLLYAGESKRVLHTVDYKTGFTSFNVKSIYQAFQFQTHAWLILNNYEAVDELEVRIWRTRTNDLSPPVTFSRDDLEAFDYRIKSAATAWQMHRHAEPETCIAHPTVEGCELCPAKSLCPVVPRSEVDADPADYLRRLWALDTKVRAMEKDLAAYVQRTGADVTTPDGMAFGFDKPAAERKSTAKLYSTKGA